MGERHPQENSCDEKEKLVTPPQTSPTTGGDWGGDRLQKKEGTTWASTKRSVSNRSVPVQSFKGGNQSSSLQEEKTSKIKKKEEE